MSEELKKRHNELVLSSIPTADLVAELATRDEVEYRWRLNGRDERWPDKHAIPVCGPCKILVVRE